MLQSENIALCTLCVCPNTHFCYLSFPPWKPFIFLFVSFSFIFFSHLLSHPQPLPSCSLLHQSHFPSSALMPLFLSSLPPTKEAWCDGDCLSFTQGELVCAKLAGDLAGGETINDQWNRCKEDKIKAYPMMCHTGDTCFGNTVCAWWDAANLVTICYHCRHRKRTKTLHYDRNILECYI